MTIPARTVAKHNHRKPYKGYMTEYMDIVKSDGKLVSTVGACGHSPGDFDVKISSDIFTAPPPGTNLSASCGLTLRASNAGVSNNLTVYDECKCTGSRQP